MAILAAGVLLCGGCNKRVDDRDVISKRIELRDVVEAVEKNDTKTLIIDSRRAEEFDAGHIPGARRIDPYAVDTTRKDPTLSAAKKLIIYGKHRNDPRALVLGKRLITAEYKGVQYFEEGFEEWMRGGHRVESAPAEAPAPGGAAQQPARSPAR